MGQLVLCLLKTHSKMDVCDNCKAYSWHKSKVAIKRNMFTCKACKLIYYCSRECQAEHWKKVHRKHCKYMAKQKSGSVKRHSDNCSKCKYEKDYSEDIKKVDNPFYPCHIKYSYKKPTEDA